MAWQRTIPFGYRMRQGQIELDTAEADTVKDIFARYLQGESLQHIAEALMAQAIRYHERTGRWNKNMVKRVLENTRYLGHGEYPCVINMEDFRAAQMRKADRNTHAPCKVGGEVREKTVCGHCGARFIRVKNNGRTARWECENPDCGHAANINDERLNGKVHVLLDTLVHTPEALAARIPREPTPNGGAQRIANELTNAFNRGTESAEYLRTLIFACAAERYNELPDSSIQYKVDKIRGCMESGETDESLPRELLDTAVRAIRVTDTDNITLVLVNGAIITEEEIV